MRRNETKRNETTPTSVPPAPLTLPSARRRSSIAHLGVHPVRQARGQRRGWRLSYQERARNVDKECADGRKVGLGLGSHMVCVEAMRENNPDNGLSDLQDRVIK